MSEQEPISPRELIAQLGEMERRATSRHEAVPQQDKARTLWDGIAFNLMSTPVVAQLNDIKEILNLPSSITRVPGTRNWLLGIANIRGNLLPISDHQLYLGGKPIGINKRSRVLVIDQEGFRVGLLVGGVQGILHFKPEQHTVNDFTSAALAKYASDAFRDENEIWPVFNVQLLAEDEEFQMASL